MDGSVFSLRPTNHTARRGDSAGLSVEDKDIQITPF